MYGNKHCACCGVQLSVTPCHWCKRDVCRGCKTRNVYASGRETHKSCVTCHLARAAPSLVVRTARGSEHVGQPLTEMPPGKGACAAAPRAATPALGGGGGGGGGGYGGTRGAHSPAGAAHALPARALDCDLNPAGEFGGAPSPRGGTPSPRGGTPSPPNSPAASPLAPPAPAAARRHPHPPLALALPGDHPGALDAHIIVKGRPHDGIEGLEGDFFLLYRTTRIQPPNEGGRWAWACDPVWNPQRLVGANRNWMLRGAAGGAQTVRHWRHATNASAAQGFENTMTRTNEAVFLEGLGEVFLWEMSRPNLILPSTFYHVCHGLDVGAVWHFRAP